MKRLVWRQTAFNLLWIVSGAWAADPSSMTGTILCGYQGWFRTPDDGCGRGWAHYAVHGRFEPGFSAIDAWPDVSELDADERTETPFRMADGSPAFVFSSANAKTVMRHFKWMQDYGIDGVFLQRFLGETKHPKIRHGLQRVLSNVRAGAERHNRIWALMYDLSGAGPEDLPAALAADWRRLCTEDRIRGDRQYLHHAGKPVVAVWGMGFNDNRRYTPAQCLEVIRFLKDDPVCGGNTVMVGVPTYWREGGRDSIKDPLMKEIAQAADIISPWAVGRFKTPEEAARYARTTAATDLQWCRENRKEFLPVAYPGFSWCNLMKSRGVKDRYNAIPRSKGMFLQALLDGYRTAGATMVYQAMFDEMDEGTAIFKCATNPPSGGSRFLDMEGVPTDFYLRLVGKATRELRRQTKEKNIRK